MKLTLQELTGLRQMIVETSNKVLNKYKLDNQNLLPNFDSIFIGDSMIEYFDLNKYLHELNAINRGIAGATTKLIKDNLDTIFGPIEPKYIYISIGSNDLVLLNASVDEAYQNITELIEIINKKYPNALINYLSTTPVVSIDHKLYKKIYIGGRTNGQLKALNYKVSTYATLNNINYLHMFDELLDEDKFLSSEFTMDGIHLNHQGYQIYSKIIQKYLK
ncbi:GDSL-type esterase/lipase family protein [Acholeplasma granularum]|uniref:GDSL-type esterase/lipase family protein n=1 Tax=Acholeplasma granularum TaxID=264635 RepID=UPI00046E77B1|nr:GDSL-type esterase/lipase family protein [Acholeplasma granularum]